MAPWDDSKLFFCFLFITCCCTVTLAELPMDCCLSVVKDLQVAKAAVAHVRKQISGQGCSVDATILVTRRGIELCVPSNEVWVQGVEKHVQIVKEHCKKRNYKGNRCTGVKPEYY